MSKAKMTRRAEAVVEPLLGPDETPVAGAQVIIGPSIWFRMFVLDLPLVSKYRWVLVTDRRVIFLSLNKYTSRMRFHHADPLAEVAIVRGKGGPFWGNLRYRTPDGRVLRLNFPPRFRRKELRAIWDAIGSEASAQGSGVVGATARPADSW